MHSDFKPLTSVHTDAMEKLPKWIPPQIERQEWLSGLQTKESDSDNEQHDSFIKLNTSSKILPPKKRARKKKQLENDNDWNKVMKESGKLIDYIRTIKAHPRRLHNELWYNDLGQANDGPLCRCEDEEKSHGVRHSIYPGERRPPNLPLACNNLDVLHHYRQFMKLFVLIIQPVSNSTSSPPRIYDKKI